MITKLSTFKGVTASGDPLVQVFHQGDSIRKVAGAYHPDVRDFLGTYRSDKNEIALLINAMGGSEYWGQNVNGDVFPWQRLAHDCTKHHPSSYPFDEFYGKQIRPYGFKTFLQAHPFVHHQNKDPNRAFGKVNVSCLNQMMKRVELVALIDRNRAHQFDASSFVDAIDRGEFPDVSMGCRVPYDVCTICGNKSRNEHDQCFHVKELGLNYIFPDGRKVGVINLHPIFFDISFVTVGADRTAKVMEKLAGARSQSGVISSAQAAEMVYVCDNGVCGLVKKASIFVPDHIVNANSEKHYGKGKTLYDKLQPTKARDFYEIVGGCPPDPSPTYSEGILRTNVGDMTDSEHMDKEASCCSSCSSGGVCSRAPEESMDPMQAGPEAEENNKASSGTGVVKTFDEISTMYADQIRAAAREAREKAAGELKAPPHREQYPYHGKRKFKSLPVLVENAAGTWRTGKGWQTKMKNDYGEIDGSLGSDGDPVDVYLGPEESSNKVFIVHQNHVFGPKKGQYDEDKVMLGFSSSAAAKKAYLDHYDRPDFFRSITEMDFDQFKKLIFQKEGRGEKLAAKEKKAEDLKLEDLFNHKNVQRRERTWKDSKGNKTTVVGSGIVKQASSEMTQVSLGDVFKGSEEKTADILKQIEPDGITGRTVGVIRGKESTIAPDVLNQAGEGSLESALATPAMMGMVLKPEEFQRILLSAIGKTDVADQLDAQGVTFAQSSDREAPCGPLTPEHFDRGLMEKLLPMVDTRSYMAPVLFRRLSSVGTCSDVPSPESAESPLLSKVAAAYTWYRTEMVKCAARAPGLIGLHPKLYGEVSKFDDYDLFSKEASSDKNSVGAVVASIPLSLMYAASLRGDVENSEEMGLLKRLIADHPHLFALGTGVLVREAMKNPELNKLVGEIASNAGSVGKRILVGGA